ncbi:hypothetical protein VNI00_015879 [Paramarasmius palmivorus]|uniref:Uncharacterized protein n=1 Tax=Paramarasmius palmivorus TaxID=297713 RepID=A0AAW0BFZ6_9AGAR
MVCPRYLNPKLQPRYHLCPLCSRMTILERLRGTRHALVRRSGRLRDTTSRQIEALRTANFFKSITPLPMIITYESIKFGNIHFICGLIPTVFYGPMWNGNIAHGVNLVTERFERAFPEEASPETGDEVLDRRFAYLRRNEIRGILYRLIRLEYPPGHRLMFLANSVRQHFSQDDYENATDTVDLPYMSKQKVAHHIETVMPDKWRDRAREALISGDGNLALISRVDV